MRNRRLLFPGVTILFSLAAAAPARAGADEPAPVSVYAAAVRASDEYFLALQKELALRLGEGVILIERQDVTIL